MIEDSVGSERKIHFSVCQLRIFALMGRKCTTPGKSRGLIDSVSRRRQKER